MTTQLTNGKAGFSLPTPKEHLSSPVTRDMVRVQQKIVASAREFLGGEGFMEFLPPLIGPVTDPAVRGAKQVDIDYYGHRYKLMASVILYKQATLVGFDKIFYIAPNVRLEPPEASATHRHLAEFHQIDVEMAGATREQITGVLERLVTHIVRRVVEDIPDVLEALGRDIAPLKEVLAGTAFGRMTHSEAVKALQDDQHDQSPDAEIDWPGEEILARKATVPFFLLDYPKGSRGFYDRESKTTPGQLNNFDLIAPEGYGELSSGSEREFEYDRIMARMRETGENPAKYEWYLNMVREGIPDSAGFGLGLERLTRYLCGLDAVWQASAYPKVPGVVSP
ncbi:asparagine synthetase A [Amycolatopsis sp. CA-230715]|uniref:asparagine synthetase A n=1 Tax=Amycolatopsis sp. CA-230715 TaxID=2745196 RepID=UPI001C03332E|nr:asparagine synthetase A [Amycolatopsis sp. CA-230715]QWF84116.1 Asparagine--tRNA ligase [Amycolatopsis sp. CA-230715]